MKKVMVFGTFDILHKGHLDYFRQAKKHGDYLIAVVARDKTVLAVKGRLPLNNEKKRVKFVKKFVDKAILGGLKNRHKVVVKYKPDVICLGYDQKADVNELKRFSAVKRMKSYYPEKYKSSKIRKN